MLSKNNLNSTEHPQDNGGPKKAASTAYSEEEERLIELEREYARRNIAGFWFIGLLNNIIYVIMNAGAKSISAGGVGVVYAVNSAPALIVKGSLPYIFEYISYETRVLIVAFLNILCLLLVGTSTNLYVQLVGVASGAFASALGEATFLGYSARFPKRGAREITAWSSGTGMAGIAGYAWNIFWEKAVGTSFSVVCLTGLALPTFWVIVFYKLMVSEEKMKPILDAEAAQRKVEYEDVENSREDSFKEEEKFGAKERFVFIITKLWPYMIPLFLVYFAEYSMQAGAWAAIGNPMISTSARGDMYSYLNWMYQAGVFVSRSSGAFLSLNKKQLWIMPMLQIAFLIFFVTDSLNHFWINYGLLFPAFLTGLLGGAVYVHGYLLISKEIDPKRREFSLTAASIADTFGILSSDILGVFLQGCIYAANDIVDCSDGTCTAPTFTCGHTFNTTFNPEYL